MRVLHKMTYQIPKLVHVRIHVNEIVFYCVHVLGFDSKLCCNLELQPRMTLKVEPFDCNALMGQLYNNIHSF